MKMKVLNLIWKYTTGGIGKCFITYSKCSDVDDSIKMVSACIDPKSFNYDREPLKEAGTIIINIKNRFDVSWINKVYMLIKKENPDLIFTHGLYGPIIVLVTKLIHPSISKISMIASYHGLYNPPTIVTAPISFFFNHMIVWIYKYFTKKIIIVSKFSGQYLIDHGVNKNKIEVVYNGLSEQIAIDNPKVKLPTNRINIGLTARVDAIKGIDYLLKAVAIIKQKTDQKFHLYIIGDGPLIDKMEKMASELHITNEVTFTGYKNNISSWLNCLDIFVLPSLQENHSIALLEAMRAGKPIVCTNVGGNPETVSNNIEALVVPCKNSSALAEALLKLIQSHDLRKKLGDAAYKKFISNFTEKRTKQRLVEVFKSLHYEN